VKAPAATRLPFHGQAQPKRRIHRHDDALDLAKGLRGRVEWDPVDRSAWISFIRDDLREWIFFTDARHVPRALYAGKRPRPAGILLLGSRDEDAGIWELLPSHK